uniref:J domain-containing protein n=1 Tax=Leersia perrieri TaxID=77586 RepID=A0A0D9VVP1_9ORYZ
MRERDHLRLSYSSKQDRALQAKNLAERCFLGGDVAGAKQWCQSAQKLDPDLPGVAQASAAYDVHYAAARKSIGVAGESGPDWYAVLNLPPARSGLVTHDAVKKQYRKLCLLVHPDKNTSAAADGAFKLVQSAWDVLSARHPSTDQAVAYSTTRPMRPQDLYRTKPTAAAAAKKQPPEPPAPKTTPPPPQQSAPRRPQVVQMRRPAAPQPTRFGAKPATVQRPTMPRPPPVVRPPSPSRGKCQYCGARTVVRGAANARSFRCVSCHRSPMDDNPCYSDEEEYYDDDY